MKNKLLKLSIFILAIFTLSNCSESEDPEPTINDNSLIIAESNGYKYVIVSPSSGVARAEIEPAVNSLHQVALGYQSQKALVTSKEPGGSAIKVIYSCDRETGNNLFQVTSEHDWDVMFLDGSPVGPQIVCIWFA